MLESETLVDGGELFVKRTKGKLTHAQNWMLALLKSFPQLGAHTNTLKNRWNGQHGRRLQMITNTIELDNVLVLLEVRVPLMK